MTKEILEKANSLKDSINRLEDKIRTIKRNESRKRLIIDFNNGDRVVVDDSISEKIISFIEVEFKQELEVKKKEFSDLGGLS